MAPAKAKEETQFLNYCTLSVEDMRRIANGSDEERAKASVSLLHSKSATKEEMLRPVPMTFWEDLICILFLGFGVPNGAFTIPALVVIVGKFLVGNLKLTALVFAIALLPLALLPQAFIPSILQSWLSNLIIKYFSYRFIFEERPVPKNVDDPDYHPRIMVAPPHGVFPYGNILAILTYPAVAGHAFRGLASSAALRPPIFKQILRSIGVVDASRHIARKNLEQGESLGISTGGVAEVFETNEDDECIVLKNRIGLIKLAIRTGSSLVPCYLFGNTKLLSCWAGEGIPKGRPVLEYISRKLGFALILIHGRFGLPIPRRIPILAVMGKSVPTHQLNKSEEPTKEQVEEIQELLFAEMNTIFETYKGLYGWEDKKLIIK
jgi:1-acyl-sn-glycerol-3-phosphate acyltransferase